MELVLLVELLVVLLMLFKNGETGYLCDGENLNSIYETIVKFYDNDNYKQLGKNAFNFSKNFHWDKIIKKYIKLI